MLKTERQWHCLKYLIGDNRLELGLDGLHKVGVVVEVNVAAPDSGTDDLDDDGLELGDDGVNDVLELPLLGRGLAPGSLGTGGSLSLPLGLSLGTSLGLKLSPALSLGTALGLKTCGLLSSPLLFSPTMY